MQVLIRLCIQVKFKVPELNPDLFLGQQSSKGVEFRFLFRCRS